MLSSLPRRWTPSIRRGCSAPLADRAGGLVLTALLALVVAVAAERPLRGQGLFIRGDCDQNLSVDISDPIALLSFLFVGADEPSCLDACDTNDSGELDITDAIAALTYLFVGGEPPPFPAEGIDPDRDADGLSCLNGRLLLRELRVTPATLLFHRIGQSEALSVTGVEDRTGEPLIDLRTAELTRYASDDEAIATIDAAGVVMDSDAQAPKGLGPRVAGTVAARVQIHQVRRPVG